MSAAEANELFHTDKGYTVATGKASQGMNSNDVFDARGEPQPPVHLIQMQNVWNGEVNRDMAKLPAYARLIQQLSESATRFKAQLDKMELSWQETVREWMRRTSAQAGPVVMDASGVRVQGLFTDDWQAFESWRVAGGAEGPGQKPDVPSVVDRPGPAR